MVQPYFTVVRLSCEGNVGAPSNGAVNTDPALAPAASPERGVPGARSRSRPALKHGPTWLRASRALRHVITSEERDRCRAALRMARAVVPSLPGLVIFVGFLPRAHALGYLMPPATRAGATFHPSSGEGWAHGRCRKECVVRIP